MDLYNLCVLILGDLPVEFTFLYGLFTFILGVISIILVISPLVLIFKTLEDM